MHADYLACSNATYINNEVVFSPFVCTYTLKWQHKCTCNKLFNRKNFSKNMSLFFFSIQIKY